MSDHPENKINKQKTKYIKMNASEAKLPIQNCKIRDHTFKGIVNFT